MALKNLSNDPGRYYDLKSQILIETTIPLDS